MPDKNYPRVSPPQIIDEIDVQLSQTEERIEQEITGTVPTRSIAVAPSSA